MVKGLSENATLPWLDAWVAGRCGHSFFRPDCLWERGIKPFRTTPFSADKLILGRDSILRVVSAALPAVSKWSDFNHCHVAFAVEAGNAVETHLHAGNFKSCNLRCARLIFFVCGNREAVRVR